ncbi:uncharacterized protein BT62DRAFT_902225, partial [Guyanagaster necrorhizus]
CADGIHTATNKACCALFSIIDDIQVNLFDGGECREDIRILLSLQLAFTDYGWHCGGDANGSIIIFSDIRMNFHANISINKIVKEQKPFIACHNITPEDLYNI